MLMIFDCDGTLVDSEYLNNRAFSEILCEEGLHHYTPERCLDLFTGFSMEECIAAVNEREGIKLAPRDIIRRYSARTIANMSRDLRTDPDTVPTLQYIRDCGIDMVVASNGEFEIVRETILSAGLAEFFPLRRIYTKDMVSYPKPAPDLFLFAIRKSLSRNEYCVVIEDSVTGVLAAKNAGLRVIGITGYAHNPSRRRHELVGAGADYIIETIADLRKLINHPQKNTAAQHTDFVKAISK